MTSERWTAPSEMFPVSWLGEGLDRGVVLHTRVESDFATTAAEELIVGLADLVGVADDTTIAVATRNKGTSPSRSLLLSDVSVASFTKLCDTAIRSTRARSGSKMWTSLERLFRMEAGH